MGPVGDPHLVTVGDIAVALLFCATSHGAHNIRTSTRLRHGKGTHVFAAHQRGQVALALCRGAVAMDLVDAQVGMGAVGEPDRRRRPRDLLHGDHVGEIAHRGAAVFLGDGDAEDAERPHLAPEVGGKFVGLVDGRGTRGDLGGGECPHRVAQHAEGFTMTEVEHGNAGEGCG